jgi:hypothetical protein
LFKNGRRWIPHRLPFLILAVTCSGGGESSVEGLLVDPVISPRRQQEWFRVEPVQMGFHVIVPDLAGFGVPPLRAGLR